jgi:hypothetical protein
MIGPLTQHPMSQRMFPQCLGYGLVPAYVLPPSGGHSECLARRPAAKWDLIKQLSDDLVATYQYTRHIPKWNKEVIPPTSFIHWPGGVVALRLSGVKVRFFGKQVKRGSAQWEPRWSYCTVSWRDRKSKGRQCVGAGFIDGGLQCSDNHGWNERIP